SVVFPPVLVQMLDRLESEILADRVSEESRRWLASCGLTVEQIQNQMDPVYTPARKIHLYHCDHRGLPLALVSTEGATEWCAEYDEWGNLLNEENPHQLQQLIRLPGQQYDEESGLYYNRHRYYDPLQGRYITQDPIGLKGGWNFYQYPLNPVSGFDPLGLKVSFQGDESTQKTLKEAYKAVAETKFGHKITEELESSEHEYIFRGLRKGINQTCYDDTEYSFYIDIDNDHSSCVYQGKNKACAMKPTLLSVVLAHEMGHAKGMKDDGTDSMANVDKYENPFRKELGLPARMKY
ncbi:RHS repeat-associated core domain-containing protein, partial [Escherichia coli]